MTLHFQHLLKTLRAVTECFKSQDAGRTDLHEDEANHRPKHGDRHGHRHTGHETQHAQDAQAAQAAEKDFCTFSNRESPPPDPFHSSNTIFLSIILYYNE